jgi:hypothetical protein
LNTHVRIRFGAFDGHEGRYVGDRRGGRVHVIEVYRAKVTGKKGSDAEAKPQDAAELDALLPPDTVWLGG